MILAIDPGLSGGVAFQAAGEPAAAVSMPPTEGDVVDLLRGLRARGATHAYLEDVPWVTGAKISPASTGKLQRNVGVLRGALLALGIPHTLVAPHDWQKPLRLGTRRECASSTEWKNKLKAEAQRRFPHLAVTLATADALLLLDYAGNSKG
jgi:hypothetical protein